MKKTKINRYYNGRGPTFIGFYSRTEAGKKERLEKFYKKYKKQNLERY